jgi:hypothetical protein
MQGYCIGNLAVLPTNYGLRLTWEAEEIKIEVSRLHQHKDGRTTGEINITHGLFGHEIKTLHRAQFNFGSTASRTQLEKVLVSLQKADWKTILQEMCSHTIDFLRKGEPVELINTEQTYEPPQYLLYPIILKNEPNIIFGEGESAKSLLAELFAICIELPLVKNEFGLTTNEKSTRTLYLDWETNRETIGWRFQCLIKGLDLPYLELNYRRCYQTLSDDIDAISNAIAEVDAKCIIVDSIAAASGGDINSAEVALNFFAALRKLKISSILIAHTAKDNLSTGNKKTVFGSAFYHNYARSVWQTKKTTDEGEDDISVGLFHRKGNFSKRFPPIGFSFNFNEDKIYVHPQDIKKDSNLLQEASLSTRIIELLKGGAKDINDMAEELGSSKETISVVLSRLKSRGSITKTEGHKWGLLAKEYDT